MRAMQKLPLQTSVEVSLFAARKLFRICTLHSALLTSVEHTASCSYPGQWTSRFWPFQDLYARFATRLAQKSMGGDKMTRRGRHRFYCSALLSYYFLAGWEVSLFHAMTILSRGDQSGILWVSLMDDGEAGSTETE